MGDYELKPLSELREYYASESTVSPSVACNTPRVPATVVVGAQWGDEGKGKIVDCSRRSRTSSAATRAGRTRVTR